MPTLGVAETKVNPAGSRSVPTTPVALLGPLLAAVTVNVTLEVRAGVGLWTVLVTGMPAACPVTVADAVSLPATGSGCTSAVFVAVLITGLGGGAVAPIDSAARGPLGGAP